MYTGIVGYCNIIALVITDEAKLEIRCSGNYFNRLIGKKGRVNVVIQLVC